MTSIENEPQQFGGIKSTDETNQLNNVIKFKKKITKLNTKQNHQTHNNIVNINQLTNNKSKDVKRFFNLGVAPKLDVDAEIRKSLSKNKLSKSPHKRNASVYQTNFKYVQKSQLFLEKILAQNLVTNHKKSSEI